MGQAVGADHGPVRPGLLFLGAEQGLRLATGDTITTEGAFAFAKIDSWITTIPGHQNVRWAGRDALVAACAAVDEIAFRQGPGRAFLHPRTGATPEESAAG